MKAAFLQYNPFYLQVGTNLDRVEALLHDAEADLIVLPELFASGYFFKSKDDLWQVADVRTRSAFVELLEKDIAGELLEEIGGTMLDDPDIDVRLALLKALVRSGSKKAVSFIERRLKDIEEDTAINPDKADRERTALLQAKGKLKKGPRKRENPWDP